VLVLDTNAGPGTVVKADVKDDDVRRRRCTALNFMVIDMKFLTSSMNVFVLLIVWMMGRMSDNFETDPIKLFIVSYNIRHRDNMYVITALIIIIFETTHFVPGFFVACSKR